MFLILADWTGAMNYFRNLPFWKLSCGENSIIVPCLLIVGNKDSSVQMESIIKSTDYVQKYILKVVEGASHYLHQQRPNEVNKLISNFLIGKFYKSKFPNYYLRFSLYFLLIFQRGICQTRSEGGTIEWFG